MEHLRLGVVGNIGAGKTSLVTLLQTRPYSDILLEAFPSRTGKEEVRSFEEQVNAAVRDAFYSDPKQYALTAQIEFFNGRYERQLEVPNVRGIIIEDRILAEDYHIFGKAQQIEENMSAPEFYAYQRTFRNMSAQIPWPDLIIYLKCSVDTSMRRIKERGIPSEQNIERSYIELLHTLYEEFISREVPCPVIILDADEDMGTEKFAAYAAHKVADKIKSLGLRVTMQDISDWVSAPIPEATVRAIEAENRLRAYLQQNPRLITCAGNIAVGKSTLARMLAHSLHVDPLYENPLENPILKDFLADKKKYCFDLQMHFLHMRAAMRRQAKESGKSYIKDRSLAEDLLVFCDVFHQQGLLSDDEFDNLTIAFRRESRRLPSSDLLVLVQGTPKFAYERMMQRNIKMEVEGGWQMSDICAFDRRYRTYADDVRRFGFHDGPVLEIDMNSVDPIANRIHMGYLCEQMYNLLTNGEQRTEE